MTFNLYVMTSTLTVLLFIVGVASLSGGCVQFEDLGILRSHFFRLVQEHTVEEDVQQM